MLGYFHVFEKDNEGLVDGEIMYSCTRARLIILDLVLYFYLELTF